MSTSNQTNKSYHLVLHVVLALALGISLAFHLFQEKKEDSKVEVTKCDTFTDLPKNEQLKYVNAEELHSLKGELAQLSVIKDELYEQLSELGKNNLVQEQSLQDTKAKKVDDFAACYTMDPGSYIIFYECKKNIIDYVKKHKDAKYFEIIGIVDDGEFRVFRSLENNKELYSKLGITQHAIDVLKKLTQAGLAKHRAIEASWVIKAQTNREAITYNTHYHLVQKDGKRGFVIRAYK